MPQYSIKVCTYDPAIIDAFDRLRKNRKQAAFTHEALKYLLTSEKGEQVILLMEGHSKESTLTAASMSAGSLHTERPTELLVVSNSSSEPQGPY